MKILFKRIARTFGVEIQRYNVQNSESARLIKMLKYQEVDLILDIGANDGIFGRMLREHGYRGRIVSFEPLSSPYERLISTAKNDPLWSVAPRMALGSEEKETVINVSGSSTSSSILGILPHHVKVTPEVAYVGQETVYLRTLDNMWGSVVPDHCRSVFLKIDVQGYEDKVLEGAKNALTKIRGIQIELSLVPLYEGQLLFDDLYRIITGYGFGLHAFSPVYSDSMSGRLLQFDGVFFR